MRRSIRTILLAVLLVVVGAAALIAGRFDRRMAIAQEDTEVLDFADPQADYALLEQDLAKLPWKSTQTVAEIKRHRAELQYWQHDYATLADIATAPAVQAGENGSTDPELLLIAANAAFRTVQRGPQDKASLMKNLTMVIHAYSEALRAGNDRADAAYNYELAVRLREAVGAGKLKSMSGEFQGDDKSEGSMHGDPGEPPKEMKVDQFEIRVPMDSKDMKNSQDQSAGTGQVRRRRG